MKLGIKQYYVRLDSAIGPESPVFSLKITSDIDNALTDWQGTTRVSPLWQLLPNEKLDDSPPEVTVGNEIIFLSAVSPATLSDALSNETLQNLGNGRLWLTLGTYNIIVLSSSKEMSDELVDFCHDYQCMHERWPILQVGEQGEFFVEAEAIGYVNPKEFSLAAEGPLEPGTSRSLNTLIPDDHTSRMMIMEFYALMGVIRGRSKFNFPALASDANDVEKMVGDILKSTFKKTTFLENNVDIDPADNLSDNENPELQIDEEKTRDLFLTLNAGLARLSSQALSGSTPLAMTECHFWPHSLLGTGIANVALRNVASYVTTAVTRSSYNEKFEILLGKDFSYSEKDLNLNDDDWDGHLNLRRDLIAEIENHEIITRKEVELYLEKNDGLAPNPITFFSGRDGFRNSFFTTSAPLMSISGSNSFQWNLGTVTHELSHRIISGKLEKLFKGILAQYDSSYKKAAEVIIEPPKSVGEFAQSLLAATLMISLSFDFEKGEFEERLNDGKDFYGQAKLKYAEKIEEMMVHMFDFYHFYGFQPKTYIDFVWLSWAVQPSILEKLDEYILRTLTALAVTHFGRPEWQEKALADFERVLNSEPLKSKLKFKDKVLDQLHGADSRRRGQLKDLLSTNEHLLTLFHYVFKSVPLHDICMNDPYATPRTSGELKYNYTASRRVFVPSDPAAIRPQFSNPLMFLRDFSRDIDPNASNSAWLFHLLVFNQLDSSGHRDKQ